MRGEAPLVEATLEASSLSTLACSSFGTNGKATCKILLITSWNCSPQDLQAYPPECSFEEPTFGNLDVRSIERASKTPELDRSFLLFFSLHYTETSHSTSNSTWYRA